MLNKYKFIGLALLISTVILSGCNLLGGNKADPTALKEIKKTQAEKDKAKLLRQIDRKFENPEAHFELGQLYQTDGLWAKAENEYRIALAFDPVHRQAQAARVKVLLESRDTPKAELLAEIYTNQAATSAMGSLKLALGFQKHGLDEKALTCYQQALRIQPNSAKINRQIGYYYLSKNNNERALDYLSRSFNLNPDQPEVAGQLGRLGVEVKRPSRKKKNTKQLDKTIEQYDKQLTL